MKSMRFRKISCPLEQAGGFFGEHIGVVDNEYNLVYDATNRDGTLILQCKNTKEWLKGRSHEVYIESVPRTSNENIVVERLRALRDRLNLPFLDKDESNLLAEKLNVPEDKREYDHRNYPSFLVGFEAVNYNHLERNCEHVANWVLTGKWISPQGFALKSVPRDIGRTNFLSSQVLVSSSSNLCSSELNFSIN